MLARLNSNNSAVSKAERAKVVSELSVLRNSIDVLPEINVSDQIDKQKLYCHHPCTHCYYSSFDIQPLKI